ncbi:MAG: glycosyltransferase family 2 protein, partial [Endomicrobiia bacterium]|nr:glycosyltransferase family 2 protein [Endomicrobiia bacterium]
MWKDKRVSLVLPAYNEEENINAAVEDFKSAGIADDIIVVDNNSRDRTAEIAASCGASVVRQELQGFGNAIRKGLETSTGEYVIVSEPDGTFAGEDIIKFLVYADEFDMVVGTRTSRAMIWDGANMGFFLKFGNWAVAKFLELLFNGPS